MPDIRDLNISIELWSVAFCAVCIVCCLLLVREKSRLRTLIVAGLALELVAAGCDALAGVFRGQEGQLAWVATHVGNAASFIACFFLLATLTSYLCMRIEDAGGPRYRRWEVAVWALAVVMGVLTLVGAHFYIDDANVYHRGVGYWMIPAYVVAVNGVNAVLALRTRRQLGATALACMLFYTLAPVVAAVAQAAFYGVDLVLVAAVLGFVVIFLEMQAHAYSTLAERTKELARAREQAADDRIAATVSQIQPHFLFNTLDTIYVLAGEDSGAARKAIAAFSRYLSTNLESLNRTTPVPIETEMGHVRTYLELERTTDPDRVAYEIDVQATGFRVPALSVQTLAENAVKHGIGARAEGGTVRVRTREIADGFVVEVEDDGAGFDPDAIPADGRAHIGIENTRTRLAAMCGGALEVASVPGEGTLAVMRIPKQEEGIER
ncbi:MAG: histidine kinase [Eggerthellaceae bacterium]|nr:histidine kinase [Eggerthellaceae bacterium]